MDKVWRFVRQTDCSNVTSDECNQDFVFDDYTQRIVIATVLCVVSVVGTIGNSLVVLAVLLSRKLRSPTNWFVLNLGYADLFTCLVLPFYIVAQLNGEGLLVAERICAIASIVVLTCAGTSAMTLALIAYNRWYLLTQLAQKFQNLYTKRNIVGMVILAWLYPFLMVIVPYFVGLGPLDYLEWYKSCTQYASLPTSNYYSFLVYVGVIIPACIAVVVLYIRIYRFVAKHDKKMAIAKATGKPNCVSPEPSTVTSDDFMKISSNPIPNDANTSSAMDNSSLKALSFTSLGAPEPCQMKDQITFPDNTATQPPQKPTTEYTGSSAEKTNAPKLNRHHVAVTKRLVFVVLAFFICLLPFGVSALVPSSDPGMPWTGLFVTINSCLNPIIYARTMPVFREVMERIARCQLREIPEPVSCIRRRH